MSVQSIRSSFQELNRIIGVKELVATGPFARLYAKRDYAALCAAIGKQLGLRNAVRLGVATPTSRFTTKAISKTDASGRGTHGIVAQVVIPSSLPMYGTSAFDAHVVEMLLGEGIKTASLATAVAIFAHELSHILLHGLRYTDRQSEQATDLVPVMLGFGDLVRRGRVVSTSEQRGNTVRTSTVTYGYLANDEFEFALDAVDALVTERKRQVASLAVVAADLSTRSELALESCSRSSALLRQLDVEKRDVRRRDASHIVAMHAPGYGEANQVRLRTIRQAASVAQSHTLRVNHYTEIHRRRTEQLLAECAGALAGLETVKENIDLDLRILSRSRPIGVRVVAALRRASVRVRVMTKRAPRISAKPRVERGKTRKTGDSSGH